ncbi:hypothetical protein GCM10010320_37470 [Streptomyces caelestis]|nr:hypothetical protein GCM10010320_37470 [Streptomyces caelestis]
MTTVVPDFSALSESGLLELRRDRIGFVFESFGLIPVLTAAENVGVPLRLRRAEPREREERVTERPSGSERVSPWPRSV